MIDLAGCLFEEGKRIVAIFSFSDGQKVSCARGELQMRDEGRGDEIGRIDGLKGKWCKIELKADTIGWTERWRGRGMAVG